VRKIDGAEGILLQEQLREIHRELGTDKDDPTGARELSERLRPRTTLEVKAKAI
jgi:ATP-dependent Lon protease